MKNISAGTAGSSTSEDCTVFHRQQVLMYLRRKVWGLVQTSHFPNIEKLPWLYIVPSFIASDSWVTQWYRTCGKQHKVDEAGKHLTTDIILIWFVDMRYISIICIICCKIFRSPQLSWTTMFLPVVWKDPTSNIWLYIEHYLLLHRIAMLCLPSQYIVPC